MNKCQVVALSVVLAALTLGGLPRVASAQDPATAASSERAGGSDHGDLAEVGAKLSNPVSDVWAHFTQFGLTFNDGDVNTGHSLIAGNMIYQPILPVPLFGEGDERWNLIVRPAIPVVFAQPVPLGFDRFDDNSGLGDTLLPLVASPTFDHLIVALGPTFLFPTSTKDVLGRRQFGIGPAGVLGWKTKDWVGGVFPQYFFGIGSRGDQGSTPDVSNMSLLYFFFYNLPEAWQIGFKIGRAHV